MHAVSRPARRLTSILVTAGAALILASGSVMAGDPVTNGFRDHVYGGGAFRPTSDKGQSKLWYTEEAGGAVQWWAGMFRFTSGFSENRIYKLSGDHTTWNPTSIAVDKRDSSHADYLWDEASNTLYVASVGPVPDTTPSAAIDDRILIYKFIYSGGVYTLATGFPHTVPNTGSVAGVSGGAATVTIAKDSTGDLWTVWPKNGQVLYSRSEDDAVTWAAGAQLPTQVGNSIKSSGVDNDNDWAGVIAFGSGSADNVGIMWSDHDEQPTLGDNGFYFSVLAAGADPSVEANWSKTKLPTTLSSGLGERADNHINLKTTSDGSVYMVGKTGADTANCATNKTRSLIEVFERTPGGTWNAHLASTVGDCSTRAQIVISEQLDSAFLFMTAPNGGGAVYRKSAPLSGPDAWDFRGPVDETSQRGAPFIRSSSEVSVDDATTTKQVVTAASGIVVNANNVRSLEVSSLKYFLHGYMSLAATDNTAPTGSVSINAGAASTQNQTVSVSAPATDPGSGVSMVEISNNADMSSSTLLSYTQTISWQLTNGFGAKTIYVRWRDGAGNWSSVANDTITFVDDTTPPNPPSSVSHLLFGSGRFGIPVRITWTAGSDTGSGVKGYQVERSVNGGAFQIVVPLTTALGHSFDLPNSAITYRFRVRTIDNRDNVGVARNDVAFKTISYSESSTAMHYSGTWGTSTSTAYIGGKARISSTRNASVSLSFRGNRVGWYSRLAPTNGTAKVYIDGSLYKTVSLFSSTVVDRKLVFTKNWTTVGNHSIRIVVAGTSGHPKIVVDQIFVLQ
jgi:hypothetical protein